MPIIRAEVESFVRLWNIHRIRKDSKRPHVVSGQPFVNYHYPAEGVHDYGQPIPEETIRHLQEDLKDVGKSAKFLRTSSSLQQRSNVSTIALALST